MVAAGVAIGAALAGGGEDGILDSRERPDTLAQECGRGGQPGERDDGLSAFSSRFQFPQQSERRASPGTLSCLQQGESRVDAPPDPLAAGFAHLALAQELAYQPPGLAPTTSLLEVWVPSTPKSSTVRDLQGETSGALAAFRAGYGAWNGNPAWEWRFLRMVGGGYISEQCPNGESASWEWRWGDSFHLSPLQFHPGSWRSAAAATGLGDPTDNFHVGANAAWWSSRVDPGGAGGWACWGEEP